MFAKCSGQPCQLLLIALSVFGPPWPDGMQTQVGNYLSFMFVDFQIRVSLWDFQRFQHVNNLLLRRHQHPSPFSTVVLYFSGTVGLNNGHVKFARQK